METPSYQILEELFVKWWVESYPMAPPSLNTIRTHAAFALHILNLESTQNLR